MSTFKHWGFSGVINPQPLHFTGSRQQALLAIHNMEITQIIPNTIWKSTAQQIMICKLVRYIQRCNEYQFAQHYTAKSGKRYGNLRKRASAAAISARGQVLRQSQQEGKCCDNLGKQPFSNPPTILISTEYLH